MLAVFENVDGFCWESFPDTYRLSPYFQLDFDVINEPDECGNHSNENAEGLMEDTEQNKQEVSSMVHLDHIIYPKKFTLKNQRHLRAGKFWDK